LVVGYNIADPVGKDRSCGIMKFIVKEKVNLSFDITANASTMRFFIDILMDCGRGEAYNGQMSNEY